MERSFGFRKMKESLMVCGGGRISRIHKGSLNSFPHGWGAIFKNYCYPLEMYVQGVK